MPFFLRESKLLALKNKEKKTKNYPPPPKKNKKNKTKQKTNKEGLGPSEVALWATSPDP